MKGKALIPLAILLVAAALLFTACNKQNDGKTGLNVFVTDSNGCTILGPDGEPLTEEWITSVVYATNENGETYTNANGDKVTVKQTRPVITSIVYQTGPLRDENGEFVTDKNGQTTMVNRTVVYTEVVTNKDGSNVTQAVTDKNGNEVTEENGEVVTENVTEKRTENVTNTIEVTLEHQVTKHYTTKKSDATKTTSVLENPIYKPTTTKDSNINIELPEEIKIASTLTWLKGIGGKRNDKYVKVLPINSENFVALGNTESTDAVFADFTQSGFYSFLTKYEADGTVKWICPLGSSGHTRMYDFARLSDGSFIAVGETNATNLGFENPDKSYVAVIAKISADGNVLWYKHIGGYSPDYFVAVTATPDGGFAAGGKFISTEGDFAELNLQGTDAVVAKFSADGSIEWADKIGGASNETLRAIASDENGNLYIACHSSSKEFSKLSTVSQNVIVAKYSPSGSQLWLKILEGTKSEEVNDIYTDGTGCVIVGRYASSDGAFTVNRGNYDAYMARYTSDGQLDWLTSYGGIDNDNINSLAKTGFGYAAVGLTSSANRDFADIGNKGGTDGFILAVNKNGEIEHVKSVAGSGNDSCNDICALDSKTFIVVGETYATDRELADITPAAKKNNGTALVGKYKIY